ncbi:MAG: tRNA (N6-isopentenyl adenosine(37)-C2)-methylthiotransferase MiaB [Vulcanimicrobiaceae bacterium]
MARIYIETFGCQMNEADSQEVAFSAAAAGYDIAADPALADVLVLNTCTVRDNAERRAYGRMNHFKLIKDADPGVRLVVMGCLAEQDRERMQQLAPHVDAVFGTKQISELGETLSAWRADFSEGEQPYSDERALLAPFGGQPDGVTDAFSHLRAFVSVQRGCSYYCTFCIVPYVRGRFDHRPMQAILADVREKIQAGAREVMLVGQTVNAWRDPASGLDFGDLCRAVGALDGLERLSFISPHPKDFTESMFAEMAEIAQLNPRIHLPLQSGSDAMLRRMNRKYTRAQFSEKVEMIRRYLPGWAITTDLIVGFPAESDDDFRQTLEYVSTGVFANAFAFIYSPRRGTPAANWEQVPRSVASRRFTQLWDAQNAVTRAYHDRKIGTVERCLVSGPSKKDSSKLAAKTLDNVTVIVPIPSGLTNEALAQMPWIDVRIESAGVWGCTGTMLRRAGAYAEIGEAVARPVLDLTIA